MTARSNLRRRATHVLRSCVGRRRSPSTPSLRSLAGSQRPTYSPSAFPRDDVTRKQIEHAVRLASLHDDVAAMDGGYECPVGE